MSAPASASAHSLLEPLTERFRRQVGFPPFSPPSPGPLVARSRFCVACQLPAFAMSTSAIGGSREATEKAIESLALTAVDELVLALLGVLERLDARRAEHVESCRIVLAMVSRVLNAQWRAIRSQY